MGKGVKGTPLVHVFMIDFYWRFHEFIFYSLIGPVEWTPDTRGRL